MDVDALLIRRTRQFAIALRAFRIGLAKVTEQLSRHMAARFVSLQAIKQLIGEIRIGEGRLLHHALNRAITVGWRNLIERRCRVHGIE